MSKKAIIAGASGLIGSELVNLLLKQPEYDEVVLLVRKQLRLSNDKLRQIIINFDELEAYTDQINGHVVFSCLGTTKKQTPDLALYRTIDHDYPLKLAHIAKQNNVRQFHLVSSLGANAGSSFFYTKLKGETEEALKAIGLTCLNIYQPSVLVGNRKKTRLAERLVVAIMRFINPLLIGGWKKYRSICAGTIASAMFNRSLKNNEGVFVFPSDKIKLIA